MASQEDMLQTWKINHFLELDSKNNGLTLVKQVGAQKQLISQNFYC